MPRLWPQIKAGVALQPRSWCQSKHIHPVMKDRTWPNNCESWGNITELYGVSLPQHAWEMAFIRVQHQLQFGYRISFGISRAHVKSKKKKFHYNFNPLHLFLKSDGDAASCYLFMVACSWYPEDKSIYLIKGNAGHKPVMSRTYTILLAHNISCVSLWERLKLSEECSDSNSTAAGREILW